MRKIAGLLSMMGLALVLVACGGEDDPDPTATPPPTVASTATTAATEEPTEDVAVISSPVASPAATPIGGLMATPIATPANGLAASPAATPAMGVASPEASPAASPVADDAMAVAPADGDSDTRLLSGTVLLPGTENERYVMSGDGCVGLGRYNGVQAGQQVVIKDESGTIVGLTTLAATESQVACSWTFEVEVPASTYYTVSLPLVAEVVVSDDDVVRTNGEVQVSLP